MARNGPLVLATAAAVLFAVVADAQPLGGAFRGDLVCEQLKSGGGMLRAPLEVIVRGSDVIFARPVFGGRIVVGSELGSGTIAPDGKIHLTANWENGDTAFVGDYGGTLTAAGGMLSGTETWHYGGASETRNCTAALVRVRTATPPASAQ